MWEIFNLTNNAGYLNTSEFKLIAQTTPEQEKTALLETKLDENGLIWDEEAQEYIPVDEKEGEKL